MDVCLILESMSMALDAFDPAFDKQCCRWGTIGSHTENAMY